METFNEEKLKEFIKNKDFVAANNYIKNSLLLSDENSIKYLHEFINKNDINISSDNIRVKDIDIGIRKLISQIVIIGTLFIILLIVVIFFIINYKLYRTASVLIIMVLLLFTVGIYFLLLLLDLITGKSDFTKGNFNLYKTNSILFSNYIVKFENGKSIIVPRQIYFKLEGYNSCSIERYKYSKILKNIKYKEI